MKIREITDVIERFAPLAWQEGYDNAGLIVGAPDNPVHRALLTVDVTEAVLDEAERTGCDLVIAHHPLIFHPLKRLNGATPIERCVARALRSGIAIYACHTNLDSAPGGMSWRLAEMLGIGSLRLLSPSNAGEGRGFGVVGELAGPVAAAEFLQEVKRRLQLQVIRHSALPAEPVRRVALCTGAGASLIGDALASGAQLYITSDLKYNDFLDTPSRLTVADIGHFESEYCAIQLLYDILSENLITFAVRKSDSSCNPVNYIL